MFFNIILTKFASVKILDKYILKSFLKPFLATFFIILFVLVMQALWLAFESFAGKGITSGIIIKFLWYTMLLVAPQALPIGVLLSSIMTLGNLSEKYEFAAAKASGISLPRIVRPLIYLTLFLSIINFTFLNYVYPYAMLKQINMRSNIKNKQPSLALVPGSFNTEIPNFQIKFSKKYGKDKNFLKDVMIYDLSSRRGNNKIITAETGELISDKSSRYMTLILRNGHFFEHHFTTSLRYNEQQRMPASYADFDEYVINIDVSDFMNDDLEKEKYTKNYNMLSLEQLSDTLPVMKEKYDEYIENRARSIAVNVNTSNLYKNNCIETAIISQNILDNFEKEKHVDILRSSIERADRTLNSIEANKKTFKYRKKILNHYDIEYYNRIALSLSCLLLFFIGAPLGSIIRKGGMGLPMIFAIVIYVTYHFSNTLGRNMAEESSITAIVGSWISMALMLPLAILLTTRATQDKGVFNINGAFTVIVNFFKTIFSKNREI